MRKHFTNVAIIALVICILRATAVSQAGSLPLSLQDALLTHDLTLYSPPRISSDGKWLAYALTDNSRMHDRDVETWVSTGVPVYAVGSDIFLLNLRTGDSINLTGGVGNNCLPSWSPDGRSLAFLSDRDGKGQTEVWVYDLKRRELRPLSGLKTRMLAREIQWTADGRALIVGTLPEGMSIDEYVHKYNDLATQGFDDTQQVHATASLYRSFQSEHPRVTSDPWSLNLYLCDLAVIELGNGDSHVVVRGERVGSYRVSPDGLWLAYSRVDRFEQPGSQQILFSLLSVALTGTHSSHVLATQVHLRYDGTGFSWSPDSAHLAYRALGPVETTNDCYVVDADGTHLSDVTNFAPSQQRHISRTPIWDPAGKSVYFTRDGVLWQAAVDTPAVHEIARIAGRRVTAIVSDLNDRLWTPRAADSATVLTYDMAGRQDGFYRIDLATGATSKLLEQGQCYTCRDTQEQHDLVITAPDATSVLYLAEDARHEADVWMASWNFKAIRRVTDANPQFAKYDFASSQLVDWLSDDGQQLEGTLLLPSPHQRGERLPLIVMVYGGDTGSDRLNRFGAGERGPFNLQLLATRGYAVLVPDAPQNLGTPMLDLAKSVLPGVNKVIELGVADPHRLGLIGESYGGYSVMSLLVQTTRFKAAVEVDGYGDIVGSYGGMRKTGAAASVSNEETGQGLMGGPPWEHPLRYIDNSPIFYLDRVNTPLLIAHGADDETVGSFLGDELFVGLRRLGKEVDYVKYQGENHYAGMWSYADQLDYANRMIDWFARHLMAH